MQRDLDLCLKILRDIEAMPPGAFGRRGTPEDPIPPEVIHHIDLLINAGLLEGDVHPVSEKQGGGLYAIRKITWAGHDFLQAARDDDIWTRTKARLKTVGGWTFSLVLEVLKDEAKKRLGLGLSE